MGIRREVAAPGFTLLELIVALFVIALAVALVSPVIGRSTDSLRERSEVARFSAMIRHARDQAITTRRGHAFVVDLMGHRAAIVAAPDQIERTRALPAEMKVEANPPQALTVRFEPSGVSSGGEFRLTTASNRYLVTVDPLTGRVRVERRER